MVCVTFGPRIDGPMLSILRFIVFKLNPAIVKYHDYDGECKHITTILNQGEWFIEDVKIKISHGNIHALAECIDQEYSGFIEGPIESINKLFETANDHLKNLSSTRIRDKKLTVLNYDYNRWEIDSTICKRSFSTIHLPPKIMKSFRDDIDQFMSTETVAWYKKLEIPHSRVYLLHGPPGTCKTSLIQGTASYLDMNIATFSVDDKTRDHDLKMAFKRLPRKTIMIIEDIDALFENRKTEGSHLTFSGVLNALDGVSRLMDMIIFITTNHIDKLDSAVKRRIDYFQKFDFCVKSQVHDIFKRFRPDDDFDEAWKMWSGLKLTPNILQKFLIRKKPIEELAEFVSNDCGLGNLPDMYL